MIEGLTSLMKKYQHFQRGVLPNFMHIWYDRTKREESDQPAGLAQKQGHQSIKIGIRAKVALTRSKPPSRGRELRALGR